MSPRARTIVVPTIARAVGVQVLGRGLGTIASLFTVAVVTRYLGVSEYGLLTSAVIFVSLWTSLAELGVSTTIVRKAGDGSGDLTELTRVNVGLSLIYSIPLAALCAITGLLAHPHQSELTPVLLVVSASLALTTVSTCFQPVFIVHMRFAPVALADVSSRVGTLAATGLVIAWGGGVAWIAAAQLVPPIVQLVVLTLAARRLTDIRPRFAPRAAARLVRESLPITAVAVVGVLYWRADGLILSLLSDSAQVAAYGLAYAVAFNLSVISTFYLHSSLAAMTSTFPVDRTAFAVLVGRSVELMLFLGVPVMLFGGVLAGPVVALVGSARFVHITRVPLLLLLVAVALTFLTGVLGQALFAAKEQNFLLRLNITNLSVNVVLNLILAGRFGAVGVGVALIASELSGIVFCAFRLRRACQLRLPVRMAVRLLVPAAAGLLALWPIRHLPVLIPLVVASSVYLAVNALVGPVTLHSLRTMLGRPGVPEPAL